MDRDVKLRWVSSISRTTNIYIISYCLPKVETNIGTTYVHVTHSNLAFICREGWNCLTSLQTPWDTYKYMRQSPNACGTLNCKVFYLDDWSNWTLSFFSSFFFWKNIEQLFFPFFLFFWGGLGGGHACTHILFEIILHSRIWRRRRRRRRRSVSYARILKPSMEIWYANLFFPSAIICLIGIGCIVSR